MLPSLVSDATQSSKSISGGHNQNFSYQLYQTMPFQCSISSHLYVNAVENMNPLGQFPIENAYEMLEVSETNSLDKIKAVRSVRT